MRALAIAVWLGACAAPVATERQAIVGGTDDPGDPAVVAITIAGGQCSGVAVAPRVVVTAAHCALPGVGLAQPGTVDFGAMTPSGESAAIVDVWIARHYDGTADDDLAAVRLDRDAPATLPVVGAPVGAGPGDPVRLVGYGATAPNAPATRGTRRQLATRIVTFAGSHVIVGTPDATTCIGDSGGATITAGGELLGIVSAGGTGCDRPAEVALPSAERDLPAVIAAWSGASPADGICTGGSDPDCDPCRFEGTCAPGCPEVDLDCPLGPGPGESCVSGPDCESRLCVPVPDGPDRGAFCSATCRVGADCPPPLGACDEGACVYAGPTPGAPGAPCVADDGCRSGSCDLGQQVCTTPCGTGGSCPRGLSCEPVGTDRACTTSGCSALPGAGLVPCGVVLVVVVRSRRRRRGGLQSSRAW